LNEITEMIGYCGYNCYLCAARSEDPAVRQRLVDGWRKLFGHEMYTAENVKCDGCPSNAELDPAQKREASRTAPTAKHFPVRN